MANTTQAKVVTLEELPRLRYQLTKSWKKAAGLLRGKRKQLDQHLKTVRKEWDHRVSHNDH